MPAPVCVHRIKRRTVLILLDAAHLAEPSCFAIFTFEREPSEEYLLTTVIRLRRCPHHGFSSPCAFSRFVDWEGAGRFAFLRFIVISKRINQHLNLIAQTTHI